MLPLIKKAIRMSSYFYLSMFRPKPLYATRTLRKSVIKKN